MEVLLQRYFRYRMNIMRGVEGRKGRVSLGWKGASGDTWRNQNCHNWILTLGQSRVVFPLLLRQQSSARQSGHGVELMH